MQNVPQLSVYFDQFVVYFLGNHCKQFKVKTCCLSTGRYKYQIDEFKNNALITSN